METFKQNIVFIIILVVLVGIGVFWYVFRGDDISNGTDQGIAVSRSSQYAATRAEILGTIDTLRAVLLDISVLDDPAFKSLSETPRPFEGEPFEIRRRNPFIP